MVDDWAWFWSKTCARSTQKCRYSRMCTFVKITHLQLKFRPPPLLREPRHCQSNTRCCFRNFWRTSASPRRTAVGPQPAPGEPPFRGRRQAPGACWIARALHP